MKRQGGFTLIEMLVVLVIISLLAALVSVGLMAAIRNSRVSSSQAMLDTIDGACSQYRVRWGDYPPSTLDRMKVKMPNDTNTGIESLVACLSSELKGGVLYQPPAEEQYANTDEDKVSKNPNKWFFGDTELREVTDQRADDRHLATKTHWRPGKFQLWTPGGDGQAGTEDDIRVSN